MKSKSDDAIIESFADVKNEIQDTRTASDIILDLAKKSPKKEWTQKMFREELVEMDGVAHSNPAINGALRKLAEAELIKREVQGKHVFYRHMPKSKK
jgi:DNA-binding transcriptional ArsR family regulator